MAKKEKARKIKRKALGKRISRLFVITVLIIFLVSAFLNFGFLRVIALGLFSMNGVNMASCASIFAEMPEGLSEYVEDVMQTYHDLPEDIRLDQDSEAYRAYFEKFRDYEYYREVLTLLVEVEKKSPLGNIYMDAYDPDTQTMVCILDPGDSVNEALGSNTFGRTKPVGHWADISEEDLERLQGYSAESGEFFFTDKDRYSVHKNTDDASAEGEVVVVGLQMDEPDCPYMIFCMTDIIMLAVDVAAMVFALIYVIVLAVLVVVIYVIVYFRIRKRVVRPIRSIADAAESYANSRTEGKEEGNIFGSLNLKTGDELQELGEVMSSMEQDIASYERDLVLATAEKERIQTELAVATGIQKNMLPGIFPAFPDRRDFDLYATMDPAKEVGGDFYDFFLIDEEHLGIVIADVSGKGIPAALFMMSSMIIIKDLAISGFGPAELLGKANDRICETNKMEMFITAWVGILDLTSGIVTAANAGHEYPAIRHAGGAYKLLRDRHGFVLGGLEGIRYQEYTFTLEPGSALFVYTDGVAEATNAQSEQYGTKRMLEALNRVKDADTRQTLAEVRKDIDRFVGDVEQFDDLTMLCVIYNGRNGGNEEC